MDGWSCKQIFPLSQCHVFSFTLAARKGTEHQSWLGVFATVGLNICYSGKAKAAYGVGIHTVLSVRGGSGAFEWYLYGKAFFFVLQLINPDNNRGRKWGWGTENRKKRNDPHSRSPWWTCRLAYTLRSCRFKLAEGIQAEDFPLTGEESLARLSLSLGVKAVTEPNAYTVVAAFQFLITAWLVRINEGSHVRMINIPIMRASQAKDDFLCKKYIAAVVVRRAAISHFFLLKLTVRPIDWLLRWLAIQPSYVITVHNNNLSSTNYGGLNTPTNHAFVL